MYSFKYSYLINLFLIFIINTAHPQIVKQVSISGNKQITSEKLFTLIKSRWQTKFDTIQVKKDVAAIEEFYFQEGFLEARCKVTFEGSDKIISFTFNIHEGSPYSFGEIQIAGSDLLEIDFIYSLLNIETGQRFSREKIVKSQLRAINTGLFEDIEIKMNDIDTEEKQISVIVDVKEKKKHATHVGTGIDTEDGAKLFFEWKNRNINRRGIGISLNALGSVDYIKSLYFKHGNYGVSIFDPYLFYLPIDWKFNLSYNTDKPKYVNFGIENYTAESYFGYSLSLLDNITIRLRMQRDRIFNASFETDHKEFLDLFRIDDNRFIGISYERDQRNDMVDPSSGLYLNLYLEKAGGFLGGNNSFTKIILNMNNYNNVFRQIVLANKLTVGSIESGNPENVPSYLRLFLGGSGSLRGFPERSVGPKNPDGSAKGGNFLFLNNFEIRYYLSYAFNLVTFFDAGNIWLERQTSRINNLKYSSGIGVRLRTKYGFFRLDFGLRLNEFPDKYIGKVHFGFGQSF